MTNDWKDPLMAGKLGSLAIYEIGITGEIARDWRDYLEATSVTRVVDANQISTTTLTCKVQDQAHLIGILNMLYEWGSVLIRIQRLGMA